MLLILEMPSDLVEIVTTNHSLIALISRSQFLKGTSEFSLTMSTTTTNSSQPNTIVVAGDVCLDVLGIPIPPPVTAEGKTDNWKQTGETRTHYLLGGALLLEHWIKQAAVGHSVSGPIPCLPQALSCGSSTVSCLTSEGFLAIAERLKREEIVHSLIELSFFPATPDLKDREQLRVSATHGFSGPKEGEPSLVILPPAPSTSPQIIVLDDTGNPFRRTRTQWPVSITVEHPPAESLVVYKLHRPLPAPETENCDGNPTAPPCQENCSLWSEVKHRFVERRIVVVSVDDLRDKDASISRGLSWERTALDLVWQLLNAESLKELRDCPHLIVRFGLNGAVYWQRTPPTKQRGAQYSAWIVYDPKGIEGTGELEYEGEMVGFGSAFTAALTAELAEAVDKSLLPIKSDRTLKPAKCIESGIMAGLLASRRLLKIGYGHVELGKQTSLTWEPAYPGKELFFPAEKGDPFFACEPIPIIPAATVPDRGYWRLLDSIFEGNRQLLHKAVALTARGAKPNLPEDITAADLLKRVPTAEFAKALRTHDRREIENYRALYSLMLDYISNNAPPRPLSIAVFGPPGAGKSFGVKQVAKALSQLRGPRPIKTLAFNLSQYESPQQLADAFHMVRDLVLKGEIPLVFFDEFDSALGDVRLGWLRYFLAPMQDAEFLDNGTPHPIGQAIFVFAGGTCATYAEFAEPCLAPLFGNEEVQKKKDAFKAAKGPDFLSRLRGTLDIPGLDLQSAFDPYGPVEAFPCEAAILLRRAGILAHQLGEKAPQLRNSAGALQVSPIVLRSLLHLPKFVHGNRSFEAMLDMSRLAGSEKFTPSLLPSPSHAELHADPIPMCQLLSTDYPFSQKDREVIAKSIHECYVAGRKDDPKHDPNDLSLKPWDSPSGDPNDGLSDQLKESNREQADHIAVKLRIAGLWFRKRIPGVDAASDVSQLDAIVERLAIAEHDRWVAEKRSKGWVAAPCHERKCCNDDLRLHNCLFKWDQLTEDQQELDFDTVQQIPNHLARAGFEIVNL